MSALNGVAHTVTTPGMDWARDALPVSMAQLLEISALLVTAVLGVWLGLLVATRASSPAARRFAVLALAIAAWGCALIVERLSTSREAITFGHALGEITGALAIAATADLALAIASEGHPARRDVWLVRASYLANLALAIPSFVDTATSPTALALGPMPEALFGWAWILARVVTLLAAAVWLILAWRRAEPATLRRWQLLAALATVVVGTIGALLRILPVIGDADAWIGVSFIALALVLAAFAVFSAGIFFGTSVAGRAFASSLVGGAVLTLLVGGLLAVDTASRQVVGIDVPLFTGLALVVAVALYEPITARMRTVLDGTPRGIARSRLFRALGRSGLGAQPATAGVGPALQRLARVLDLAWVEAVTPDGTPLAAEGTAGDPGRSIPLALGGGILGELRIGPTRSGAALTAADEELVRLSATYVAHAMRAGDREEAQVDSIVDLAEDRAIVDEQASALHAALVRGEAPANGLRVAALGPLRVERDGHTIERWGGDKAGTRQAEALFAFLFDRGERGVAKDEVLDVIWPDTELERADLAFHRTMVGLRGTLDPERTRRSSVIRFHNDRYRLDPSVVAWSDVTEFQGRLDGARTADGIDRVRLLEEARALYRGDFLDDCPFYGDSIHAEERRAPLKERFRDLLIALGESYEAGGDRLSAATAFRDAIAVFDDASGPAHAGLARLGVAPATAPSQST